jgi:hypothetical protein
MASWSVLLRRIVTNNPVCVSSMSVTSNATSSHRRRASKPKQQQGSIPQA